MENSVFLISLNSFNQVGFPLNTDHSSLRSPIVFPILDVIALYCGQQISFSNFRKSQLFFYPLSCGGFGFKLMLKMIFLFRLSTVLASFSGHWLFPAPWDAFACRTTVSLRQRSFIIQILLHASQGQMLFQKREWSINAKPEEIKFYRK